VALTAGNAITAPHDGAFTVAASDTDAALAWRHGQLIFFDQPLSSVVAEFARYGGVHVRFADPAAGRVRISGAFGARDFKSFVRDMDRLHEIHSYTDEHGETVVR
jgi:transmembrane sensor